MGDVVLHLMICIATAPAWIKGCAVVDSSTATIKVGAHNTLQNRNTTPNVISVATCTAVPFIPQSTRNHLACRKGLLISAPKSVPNISAPDVSSICEGERQLRQSDQHSRAWCEREGVGMKG